MSISGRHAYHPEVSEAVAGAISARNQDNQYAGVEPIVVFTNISGAGERRPL